MSNLEKKSFEMSSKEKDQIISIVEDKAANDLEVLTSSLVGIVLKNEQEIELNKKPDDIKVDSTGLKAYLLKAFTS